MAQSVAEWGLGRLYLNSVPLFIGVAPDAVVVHNAGDQSAHLSDVFEVISQADPSFGAGAAGDAHGMMAQAPAPYAYIIEQPAPKSLRFRYECEGRSAGSIPGVNSTQENKTFPTIKVCGYKGCMVIVVSCVTKEEPYKPHPHNLVGRDCQMGVCTVKVRTEGDADACQVQFKNLGIQCVKRRDIADALRTRQELRVNPFKTGYAHRSQPQSIDLNAVRLCFQVFLTDDAYKVQRALPPVVSDVIYDKKAMSDLLIVRSSHCSGSVKGGTTVILLCEKVTREDTEVWFFLEENGAVVWSERGHIDYVHKQLAIVLKTPPYRDQRLDHHVTVQFQLQRLSDGAKSNAYSFEYIPNVQDKEIILGHKRRKKLSYNLQEYDERSMEMAIKAEPHDRTPPHPMAAAYADQPQWRAEMVGGAQLGHAYAPQVSWQSPPYAPPSPHLQPSPMHQQPSPMHQQPSPMHQQPSPMHQQPSPMHQQPSPMHQQPSPMHQQPSPMHQQPSPMHVQQVVSPGLHPTSPYAVHLLGAQQMQHQQQMHMQSLQVGAASPMGASPAASPALMQPGAMSMPMGLQPTMDPVMADLGAPTYTQMDSTVNSTPSLTSLLQQAGDDDVSYTSGDLAHLSSLLADRHDLSDSLTRLSTRDLLQP
ncbi:embryonic polarity protein dorsal-like isoform X7 [Ostrinia furnacalis]|uniref:embryonic polarity protein dorsal-like isoform X7 n=1 Tax=Ostrinia furnacalis TaxID=93504 RepID=UPI00103E4CC4|nr:embryonic polarity protein dorsal-like isoform X7 [Ostrinia furnacalis]